jgi:hypothetical protein
VMAPHRNGGRSEVIAGQLADLIRPVATAAHVLTLAGLVQTDQVEHGPEQPARGRLASAVDEHGAPAPARPTPAADRPQPHRPVRAPGASRRHQRHPADRAVRRRARPLEVGRYPSAAGHRSRAGARPHPCRRLSLFAVCGSHWSKYLARSADRYRCFERADLH